MMRITIAVLFALSMLLAVRPVQADPYRYCADYGTGGGDAGTNCYFVTLQQCREAVSGVGGYCRENGFYDGRPVSADDRSQRQQKTKRH
jgi:hypothetical protein